MNKNVISGEAKSKCEHCDGWFHKRSMARHIERRQFLLVQVNLKKLYYFHDARTLIGLSVQLVINLDRNFLVLLKC